MGYLVVTAVLVVPFGRLGDMFGRVRIYNLGFVVFTVAAIALSFDPFHLGGGALWLIGWRVVQGVGGAMLMASSSAILTDAFPANQRGMALGVNMVAAVAGSFLGLLIGGVPVRVALAGRSSGSACRSASSAPSGAYRSLRELGARTPGKLDWAGTLTFGVGLTVLLAGITYGIQPYGDSHHRLDQPVGARRDRRRRCCCWSAFCFIELRVDSADGRHPAVPVRVVRHGQPRRADVARWAAAACSSC